MGVIDVEDELQAAMDKMDEAKGYTNADFIKKKDAELKQDTIKLVDQPFNIKVGKLELVSESGQWYSTHIKLDGKELTDANSGLAVQEVSIKIRVNKPTEITVKYYAVPTFTNTTS